MSGGFQAPAPRRAISDASATRSRTGEPSEQRRAQLQAAKRCIDCREPSPTQRCRACRARVEANTPRFHGQGHQGPKSKIETDIVDLRHVFEGIGRAFAGWQEVNRRDVAPKLRVQELAEYRAQLALALRLGRQVLRRNPEDALPAVPAAPARPRKRVPQLELPFPRRFLEQIGDR